MSNNVLPIKVVLDRSAVPGQGAALRAELARTNRLILDDAKAAHQADATAATQASKVKVDAAGRARDAMGKFVKTTRDAAKAADEAGASYMAMGTTGASAFLGMVTAIPGMLAGFDKLIAAAKAYGDAVKEAGDKMRGQGKDVTNQFDPLAKIAALQGRKVDTKFVVEQADLRARTGMNRDESIKAQEAFMDSGAQWIGEGPGRIAKEEAMKAFEATAGLAVAKRVDPGVMADLTGRMMGMKDYSKFGKDAPRRIKADVNQVMSVLSSGGGDEGHLAGEVAKVAAAMVSEDEMRGTFRSAKDVSKIISVMNEVAPGAEAETTRAMVQAIRSPKGKSIELLKEAKVTKEDDFFTAMKKLKPALEARAARGPKGTTVADVINENFPSIQARFAIGAAINKGEAGGMFDQREATAAANATPEAAEAIVNSFRDSERGTKRFTEARRDRDEARKGSKVSKITLLEEQAEADINSHGRMDGTGMILLRKFISAVSLGGVDPAADVRDIQMMVRLRARMTPELRKKYRDTEVPTNPQMRADLFNRVIGDIEATGANPLADPARRKGAAAAAPQGNGAGGDNGKVESLLEAQNAMIAALVRGMSPGVPAPLVPHRPAVRR